MLNLVQRFAKLGEEFYAKVTPTPMDNSHLVHFNHDFAQKLNLADENVSNWINILSGKTPIKEYVASSSLYAGHQFGQWVPQLGDGRAMLIAEHQDRMGNIWELQTKGSGQTPFSRGADGRAVLRSSIREYLCSHAMEKLNVPTTKALAIIGSDTIVYREIVETAAVVLRVAPSFIRFGNFEVFASRNQTDNLSKLLQFVLHNYYSECRDAVIPELAMYKEVVRQTARMVAKWQALGFCHGVMNTDNMSILGLTIDYGPFSFMDKYDPGHIYNHSDTTGRYSYPNQPYIAWWNLARLGEALLSILSEEQIKQALDSFTQYFTSYYLSEFGNKLGIKDLEPGDLGLLEELLAILEKNKVDWTIFWRQFSHRHVDQEALKQIFPLAQDLAYANWLEKYYKRINGLDLELCQQLMLSSNPVIVPRNYMLQHAIEMAEKGDFSEVGRLFDALSNPFVEDARFATYYASPPESVTGIVLSCSS